MSLPAWLYWQFLRRTHRRGICFFFCCFFVVFFFTFLLYFFMIIVFYYLNDLIFVMHSVDHILAKTK
jgi:hypothetical protein